MRGLAVSLLLALAPGAAVADSPVSAGYHEAVFSVSDIDGYKGFFVEVGGWQVLHEGDVDAGLMRAWRLPASATAREVVLGNPGTERGFVRLVDFDGVEQHQIRSNAQSWDTGGWFDVNSRVVSMEQKFAELQARDWQSTSDPVEFGFGPFVVREWLARGPDGIVIALIERVQPPLEGWPHLKEMSRLFNATQIVPDIEEAREFWLGKLGFESYLEHTGASKPPGDNVLGLPRNMATQIERRVSIVHPQGINEGSVELLQFDGVAGRDFADVAVPPNLGILTLRFPVADMDAFLAHVESEDIDVAMPPAMVQMPPWGERQVMAVRGPGGAWIEFFTSESPESTAAKNNGGGE